MCRELDIAIDSEVIPQIASGFGGGLGNTGSVCGAVLGGVMAIGLATGKTTSMEAWFRMAGVVQELRQRFEEEVGTLECREMTGMDLTSPEGIEAFMQSDVPMMVCAPAVTHAYRMTMELLEA